MSVRFDTVKAGDVLLDVHRYKAGNTTMSVTGVWEVHVISVDHAARTAVVSWNGNRAETKTAHYFDSLRRTAPEWVHGDLFGERRCHNCNAKESAGHRADCDHPKAVRARAKAVF